MLQQVRTPANVGIYLPVVEPVGKGDSKRVCPWHLDLDNERLRLQTSLASD